jgi:hypothetical protein
LPVAPGNLAGWKNLAKELGKEKVWHEGGRQKSLVGATEVIQKRSSGFFREFMWLSGMRPACVPFNRTSRASMKPLTRTSPTGQGE